MGTLWIANTCFAYNELMDFIGTDSQLTGIVAIGFANEVPAKRPRKQMCIRDRGVERVRDWKISE